jgi:hypothetical protein
VIGKTLGHYEILEPLGAGGMGAVFRARDTNLRRDVAIKVLPEALANDEDKLARLRREAQLLASVNHPNIAAIYNLEESAGTRWLVLELVEGTTVNRKRMQRIMRVMGLESVAPKPDTSEPHPEHPVFPYLLRNLTICRANHVWAADITYIPMAHGFAYLVAIIDWYSRRVLAWRLSNTMESSFCVEALREALERFPQPEIFNTDQGSQFTAVPPARPATLLSKLKQRQPANRAPSCAPTPRESAAASWSSPCVRSRRERRGSRRPLSGRRRRRRSRPSGRWREAPCRTGSRSLR